VRGDRVDIAMLAMTSAAQQKRKPNYRVAVRRLTLTVGRVDEPMDVSRTQNRRRTGGGGNQTTMIATAVRFVS